MRLIRVYVDAALSAGSVVELPPDAAAHLSKVLRVRSGDELILFTGDGREFASTVESVRGSRVAAAVGEGREVDRESPLAVTLVQGIPRGDRMDIIVQKATELGVARIVPAFSQRSVVRLDPAQAESKLAHWRAVAINACEQCGRNRLPAIESPRRLIDYLGDSMGVAERDVAAPASGPRCGDARLVLEPEFSSHGAAAPEIGAAVEIAIGPEGGFAAEELEAFRVSGFRSVRLGPRILRTETAAIAAIAWLQSRFGDLQVN
ncbi:MAG: 16S rRNA (uracil(1498)-N(3))-methyltransferase [Steroidobacteraceae bacterium]